MDKFRTVGLYQLGGYGHRLQFTEGQQGFQLG
jgi:hypothetical protein